MDPGYSKSPKEKLKFEKEGEELKVAAIARARLGQPRKLPTRRDIIRYAETIKRLAVSCSVEGLGFMDQLNEYKRSGMAASDSVADVLKLARRVDQDEHRRRQKKR